jgi:hypothetical protein
MTSTDGLTVRPWRFFRSQTAISGRSATSPSFPCGRGSGSQQSIARQRPPFVRCVTPRLSDRGLTGGLLLARRRLRRALRCALRLSEALRREGKAIEERVRSARRHNDRRRRIWPAKSSGTALPIRRTAMCVAQQTPHRHAHSMNLAPQTRYGV